MWGVVGWGGGRWGRMRGVRKRNDAIIEKVTQGSEVVFVKSCQCDAREFWSILFLANGIFNIEAEGYPRSAYYLMFSNPFEHT